MKTIFSRSYWIFIPAVIALAFHLPALFCDLIWDDQALVVEHPHLGNPLFLKEIFTRDYGLEFGGRVPIGYYRPFFILIDFLIYQIFGPSRLAYHASNVLLFCCSVTLLTWVCWTLLGRQEHLFALWAGCIFAAHPACTEVVSFFMSLPDLLMEIYALLLILLIAGRLKKAHKGKRNCLYFLLRSLLCMVIAFVSGITKESSFLIIPALGLTGLTYGLINWKKSKQIFFTTLGIFPGLGLAYLLRTWAGIENYSVTLPLKTLFTAGSGRALSSVVSAMKQIILPLPAVFFRRVDVPATLFTKMIILVLISAFILLLLFFIQRKKLFYSLIMAWFGAGMINLMLLRAIQLPYSQRFLPVAPAVIGICLIVKEVISKVGELYPGYTKQLQTSRLPSFFISAYVFLLGMFTFSSSMKCMTSFNFFTSMAEKNPSHHYPRAMLAKVMFSEFGNFEEMERYAHEAIAISPDAARVRKLGKLFAKRYIVEKKYRKALNSLDWAEQVLTNDAELYSLRAISLASLGDKQHALANIHKAIELNPYNPVYRKQLLIIKGGGQK